MSSERIALIEAVKDRLLPYLATQGFKRRPLRDDEASSAEMRTAFPFDRLERRRGDAIELLEVQLDKHGAASFIINFGIVPKEGVTLPWAHLDQENASVSALPEAFRLHSQAAWPKWFSLGWSPRDAGARAEKVVARAISLYPEIEAWFTARKVGAHLRQFGFPQNTTQEAQSAVNR